MALINCKWRVYLRIYFRIYLKVYLKVYLRGCRSQWLRDLRRRSSAARLLRLWFRIAPGSWMFFCCECCVLSGRGLWDGLITCPEESYPLWRVVVCDKETSNTRRLKPAVLGFENTTTMGCNARKTNKQHIWGDIWSILLAENFIFHLQIAAPLSSCYAVCYSV
jgi:hypothetical protein